MSDTILFYPFDVTYKVIDGKAIIYLFGRTKQGAQICVTDSNYEPYFYVLPKKGKAIEEKLQKIKIEHAESFSEVTKTEKVKKVYLGESVEAIKVTVRLPRDVPVIRDVIKDWEIIESCHEYAIPFWKRYMIDKRIFPLGQLKITGRQTDQKLKVPVFNAATIEKEKDDFLESPRLLAVDIETYTDKSKQIDMQKNPILMVALYGDKFKRVICWRKTKTTLKEAVFVKDESELLHALKTAIEEYKPDVICGYFSDGFDLPYIKTRADLRKVKIDIGLDHSDLSVDARRQSTVDIRGINHLDVFKFVKKTVAATLDRFELGLGKVAKHLLGETKTEVDLDELGLIWDKQPEKLGTFMEYNLHDAYLTYKLAQKLMPNMIEFNKIVGLPIPDIARVGFSQLVETYILRQAAEQNQLAPPPPKEGDVRRRNQESYVGGFVFEPQPGLFKDIAVFDFRSLYPTIISSHNIDPGTKNCPCCANQKMVPLEKGKLWFCSKKKGFLPALLEDIVSRRTRIKEIMKKKQSPLLEARSHSLKILANSFYGYLGFSMARWYCNECAMATAAYGRHYIKQTIDKATAEGFQVIYSDTDSIFITLEGKSEADATIFMDKENKNLPGLMELEYEGFYPAGIFVSAKAGPFGAKKKYALLKKDGNLKIRGFETVRRNWSPIAKQIQEDILNIVLKDQDTKRAVDHISKVIEGLKQHTILVEQVIMSTQLTKEIKQYDAIGPHVAVAAYMANKGMAVGPGAVIQYVVTKGKGRIRDRAKLPEEVAQKDYDEDYYVNNQVIPAVERIMDVLGFSKEALTEGKTQEKLGKFF